MRTGATETQTEILRSLTSAALAVVAAAKSGDVSEAIGYMSRIANEAADHLTDLGVAIDPDEGDEDGQSPTSEGGAEL